LIRPIADEAMLREDAVKLAAFHALEKESAIESRANQEAEAQRRIEGIAPL